MVLIEKPDLILLDIEGTTSSISFVKECLFPYVITNIKEYLVKNWTDQQLQHDIHLLRKQSFTDRLDNDLNDCPLIIDEEDNNTEQVIQTVIDNVLWQMSSDKKTTALKQFQGNLWRFGYESGDLKGHIYSDVPKAMKFWRNELSIKICIYSSGSILAQKLLFGASLSGDLTNLIDDYFDTTIGPKTEYQSYAKIAEKCRLNPKQILFLTDVPKEAIAAKGVGIHSVLSVREGTQPLTEEDLTQFQSISSFDEIQFN